VNDYGVSTVQFSQVPGSSTPRLTLNVAANSPDWQAYYSRLGGLVLIPRGGVNVGSPGTSAPPSGNVSISQSATIQSLQLGSNNQLLIRADGTIRGQGRWNARERAYEIRIPKAQLADPLQGPQLNRNSPISQLRVRQENADTVVILVRPSSGFQTGQLSQLNSQLLGLDLRAQGATSRPPRPIDTPPPPITSPPSTPLPRVRNGKVLVVIDPGHGGKDPGAIGLGGIQEKDIILPISQMLANLLEQQGVQVLMTRTSDYFVGLQGRTDMANRADADLFVSIHANSMGKGRSDVNGLEVYYFGNRRLADTIHRSILASVNIRDRGVRRARFYVLRNSKMPSTLVEVGFVTGAEDSAKLTNPSYQRQMAEAIARGVLQFIGQNNLR
jgi:N-acetylmuramoyl-L-alanine amidase